MSKADFVYTDDYADFRYSDRHPLKPYRLRLTRDVAHSYGLPDFPQSRVVETVAADRDILQRFHAPDDARTLEVAEAGMFLPGFAPDGFGPGDNPVFAGGGPSSSSASATLHNPLGWWRPATSISPFLSLGNCITR